MSDDIYQAPEAALGLEDHQADRQFYVVAPRKFAVLYMATLGLYEIYWFYRNWKLHKAYTDDRIMPIPRALFFLFFTHALFGTVDSVLEQKRIEHRWRPGVLATLFVVLSIVSNVLSRVSSREIGSPWTELTSLLLLVVMLMLLMPAQRAINLSQGDPQGLSNSRFTLTNYVWIVFGILLWGIILLGLAVMFGAVVL